MHDSIFEDKDQESNIYSARLTNRLCYKKSWLFVKKPTTSLSWKKNINQSKVSI